MSTPLPGWYPDPSGDAGRFRWWDGSDWTDHLSDDPGAPAPVSRSASAGRRTVTLLVGLTLVISGGLVGLIGWQTWRHSGPNGAPDPTAAASQTRGATAAPGSGRGGTSTAGPDGRLDEVTRTAMLASARMTLPPQPYELVGESVTVPGVFDAMFLANAPVDPGSGRSDTWTATVGLAHVPADAWSVNDPEAFAHRALEGISEQFFGYRPGAVRHTSYQVITVGARPCARLTAEVQYAGKTATNRRSQDEQGHQNRQDRQDRLKIIGCPEDDGSLVAAISSVPTDADSQLSRLAAASLASFKLN